MSEPHLSVEDVLKLVSNLMKLPFPKICRHSVALDLISVLEQKGWTVPDGLAKAICQADDETAIEIIQASSLNELR